MFYLVRHGETAWNVAGLQASFTDLPLTKKGCDQALRLKPYFEAKNFSQVWCSPLMRARETCQLAGFEQRVEIKSDLTEWHAGDYEGLKAEDIRQNHPEWSMMTHGAPKGESPEQIQVRSKRVIMQMLEAEGDIVIFSSSHFLRALAACFLGLEPSFGRHLFLGSATVSILDHQNQIPVIKLWNLEIS